MDQAENLRNVIKRQQAAKEPARVITITSGKGGVGKSNFAVNLAVQMRNMGKSVLIFDADFGLANVEVMFGATPTKNLSDFLYHGCPIRDIITAGPMDIGFISGGASILGLNNLTHEQNLEMVRALDELNDYADVILVDTGAGISDSVLDFVIASPEVLLVTTPEPSSLTDSYSLLKMLYKSPGFVPDITSIRVAANRVSSVEEGRAVFDRLESVVKRFLDGRIDYLGMVPQDPALDLAVRQQKIVSMAAPECNSSRAFAVMAENLLSEGQKSYRMRGGVANFFSYFGKL